MLTPLEFAARPHTMLDLFSGLGGASQAMVDRRWNVVRVDLDPRFKPDIIADVRQFHLNLSPDLLWASPPCTEFSRLDKPWYPHDKPPDMSCIESVYRLVKSLHPQWWVLENVRGAEPYLGPAKMRYGSIYLWGEFPLFLARPKPHKYKTWGGWGWKSKALRGKIPYDISMGLALAVERC